MIPCGEKLLYQVFNVTEDDSEREGYEKSGRLNSIHRTSDTAMD